MQRVALVAAQLGALASTTTSQPSAMLPTGAPPRDEPDRQIESAATHVSVSFISRQQRQAASELDSGDTCWMILSSALVLLMVPALGFFEAGLLRSTSTVSVLMQIYLGFAVLSLLWYAIGFTLAFGSPAMGGLIGSPLDFPFLGSLAMNPAQTLPEAPTIPGLVFVSFQMKFYAITPLLVTGAFAERLNFLAFICFIVLWSLLVYCPICHWVWGGGWLSQMGVVDWAGGIVIHASAGSAALVSAAYLGPRKGGVPTPHSIPLAMLGAALLWMGWSKASLVETANGAISGLAAITPAAGYISVAFAVPAGLLCGAASWATSRLIRKRLRIDDALDVSSVHGTSSVLGTLLVGLAAWPRIDPDGPTGLFFGGGPDLLGKQALGLLTSVALSALVTFTIMLALDKSIGVRVDTEGAETFDQSLHGESAYFDHGFFAKAEAEAAPSASAPHVAPLAKSKTKE